MLANKKAHFKVPKTTQKQRSNGTPQVSGSFKTQVTFSSSVVEYQRCISPDTPGQHQQGEEVCVGDGFVCRLFDKPYTGVAANAQWAPERPQSIVRNVSRQHWDENSPGTAVIVRTSHGDSLQTSPCAGLRAQPLITCLDSSVGMYPCGAGECSTSAESYSPRSCDYGRNLRRGSKVVMGTMSGNHALCVVRILVVDGVLLQRLTQLSRTCDGSALATANSYTNISVVSLTPTRECCGDVHNPGSPCRDGGESHLQGKLTALRLPPNFHKLLEAYLRVVLLSAKLTPHRVKGGTSLNGEEGMVEAGKLCGSASAKTGRKITEFGGAECFVSPQTTSRGEDAEVMRGAKVDVAGSPLSTLSVQTPDIMASNYYAHIWDQVIGGDAKELLLDAAKGYSLGGGLASRTPAPTQHRATAATPAFVDPRDFTLSTTIPSGQNEAKQSSAAVSHVVAGRMPILALSVFPLGSVPPAAESKERKESGRRITEDATVPGVEKQTLTTGATTLKQKAVNRASKACNRPSSCRTCKVRVPSQLAKGGTVWSRKVAGGAVRQKNEQSGASGCCGMSEGSKGTGATRDRLATDVHAPKDGATGALPESAAPFVARSGSLPEDVVGHDSNTPQFAIALSLPFVQQGNVYDVLLKWLVTRQPSYSLREAVIRNIIRGVLKQLASLHNRGMAHGSVKATNVFLGSHVMEAVAAMDEDGGVLLTPDGCTAASSVAVEPGSSSGRGSAVIFDEAETSARASAREIISNSEENNAMLELSNHVILSDGYYGDVEQALLGAFRSLSSTNCDRSVLAPCVGVGEVSSVPHESSAPSLAVGETAKSANDTLMNQLHLFTIKEQDYLPPPECIVDEGSNNLTMGDGICSRSPRCDPKAVTKPPPTTGTTGEPVDKSAIIGTAKGIRTTHNTSNPKCPVSAAHDIWMLGVLAIHLADGGFPWWMRLRRRPLPRLRRGRWSLGFASFVQRCVCAEESKRPTAMELLSDKWFDCKLDEKSGEEAGRTAAAPTLQKPQQASSSTADAPQKRCCHRAFVDIMLEYHELAEGWYSRFQYSGTTNFLSGCSDSFHPLNNNRKEICSFTIMGEGKAPESVEKRVSEKNKAASPATASSGGSSRGSGGGRGTRRGRRDSACGVGAHGFLSTTTACGEDEERNINDCYDTETTGTIGMEELDAGDYESDAGGASRRPFVIDKPFFLGPLSQTLESYRSEGPPDAGSTERDIFRDTLPPNSLRELPQQKGTENDGSVSLCRQQELLSDLMQAFWNLHRVCRLATDVWCVTLAKHMRRDCRTVECIMPLVTDETLPFFAGTEVSSTKQPNSRDYPVGNGSCEAPGDTTGNEATKGPFKREGPHVTFSTTQQQSQQKQQSDVSPTAFHNYMLGKWCVTTSWVLQQQQRHQPPVKRLSGGDSNK